MAHDSSTRAIPAVADVPRHVAIIMDGNGRWAKRRRLPRIAGHRSGVEAVRAMVSACAERGIRFLTLFAFSSENWRRPAEEVSLLMQLFQAALTSEIEKLHRNGVRLRVVGDTARFGAKLCALSLLAPHLAMSYAPEPDLFIRTGGEQRISNFLLWQLAYSELYFTDTLWPDFDAAALDAAIVSYRARERRFGRTSDQVEAAKRPEVA
jgi:undecaprenyl diphosphate synthase